MEKKSNVQTAAVEHRKCTTGLLCHYLFGDGSAQYVFLDVNDQGCAAVVDPSLSFFSRTSGHVCGSCNGLVLFSCFNENENNVVSYSVFNLVTKQLEAVPQPQIQSRSIRTGLAFDGQHYQVVRIFSVSNLEGVDAVINSGGLLEMEIFSSERGVWRHERPLIHLPPELPKLSTTPLFSKGAIHWELGGHLLVYSMEHGDCKLIKLPNYVSIDQWSSRSLTFGQCLWESDGRLHFCYSDFEGIHTWLLLRDEEEKEYYSYYYDCEVHKFKWKLAHTVMHQTLASRNPSIFNTKWDPSFISPIAYIDNSESYMIYFRLPGLVVSYNLKTQTLKEICKYAFPETNFHCCLIVPIVCSGGRMLVEGNGHVLCLPISVANHMAPGGRKD